MLNHYLLAVKVSSTPKTTSHDHHIKNSHVEKQGKRYRLLKFANVVAATHIGIIMLESYIASRIS